MYIQVHTKSILLHFNDARSSVGLNENLWPLKGTSTRIEQQVRLHPTFNHHLNNAFLCPLCTQTVNDVSLEVVRRSTYDPASTEEFFECVGKGMVQSMEAEVEKDDKNLCWHTGLPLNYGSALSEPHVKKYFFHRQPFPASSPTRTLSGCPPCATAPAPTTTPGPLEPSTVRCSTVGMVQSAQSLQRGSRIRYYCGNMRANMFSWFLNNLIIFGIKQHMNVACFLVAQVSLLQQFRPQLDEGKAVVFIFFANLEVAHEEERLLLDFPALVHSIFVVFF